MLHAYTSAVFVFIQILLFFSAVAQLQGGFSDFYQTSIRALSLCMNDSKNESLWTACQSCFCVYLWFLVEQQTLVQMSQGSIHWLSDPFARRVDLPGLSICHALVPVWLYCLLESHKLGHRQLYPPTAAPHRHSLMTQNSIQSFS